jgi:hypothetical protein
LIRSNVVRPIDKPMVVDERAPERNMARRAGVFRDSVTPEFHVAVVAAPERLSRHSSAVPTLARGQDE